MSANLETSDWETIIDLFRRMLNADQITLAILTGKSWSNHPSAVLPSVRFNLPESPSKKSADLPSTVSDRDALTAKRFYAYRHLLQGSKRGKHTASLGPQEPEVYNPAHSKDGIAIANVALRDICDDQTRQDLQAATGCHQLSRPFVDHLQNVDQVRTGKDKGQMVSAGNTTLHLLRSMIYNWLITSFSTTIKEPGEIQAVKGDE
ncbi:MAG: hypothetical protein J3Q66DRAFT_399850 [Benniella sp.]|nr:MAG: hypothetical protein J3Q66DRAFT_399850 [Benniella sp.]